MIVTPISAGSPVASFNKAMARTGPWKCFPKILRLVSRSTPWLLIALFLPLSYGIAAAPAEPTRQPPTPPGPSLQHLKNLHERTAQRLHGARSEAAERQRAAEAAQHRARLAWAGNVTMEELNQSLDEARRLQEAAASAWSTVAALQQEKAAVTSRMKTASLAVKNHKKRRPAYWIRKQSPHVKSVLLEKEREIQLLSDQFQTRINAAMDRATAAANQLEALQMELAALRQESRHQERLLESQVERAEKRARAAEARVGSAWGDHGASLTEMAREMDQPEWERQRAQRARNLMTTLRARNQERLREMAARETVLKQQAQRTLSAALDLKKQARVAVAVARAQVEQVRGFWSDTLSEPRPVPASPPGTVSR